MEPNTFDSVATLALLLLMPASVLFVAAALRRLRIPRWAWSLYLLGIAGVLVLLHLVGHVRYEVDDRVQPFWDFGQDVGLGLGRIGVAVNAVAAVAWCVFGPREYHEQLPRRETRLLVVAYGVTAVAAALPAVWWGVGLGIVPLSVELPVAVSGVGLLTATVTIRWRRLRVLAEDDRPSITTLWPMDAVVASWLVSALAVGPLVAGTGLPDADWHPLSAARPTTPAAAPEDGDWPGPVPETTTTLDAAAIEEGTRALLEDTVRWAGPLDDLTSPTPAPAAAPTVALVAAACAGGGRRWTGSLVLPTVRPQDLAPRVQRGWDRAGYAAVDRAMGTDIVMPLRVDAAVERMRLGGGPDGVHVSVESFCTDG